MSPSHDLELGDVSRLRQSSNASSEFSQDITEHRESTRIEHSSTVGSSVTAHGPDKLDLAEFTLTGSFYRNGRNEKSKYPNGWPTIAKLQDSQSNLDIYRGFDLMNFRVLKYQACELALIQEEIIEFDKTHTEHLRSPPGRSPEFAALIAKWLGKWRDYARYLDDVRKIRQDRLADLYGYTDMITEIHQKDMLETGSYSLYNAPEEWRSFSHQEPEWFNRVLYSSFGRRLLGIFGDQTDSEDDTKGCPTSAVRFILQAINIIGGTLLVMVPACILFLVDLTKTQACIVMIISTIVFCAVMSMLKKLRPAATFRALCGYVAILAAVAVAGYYV
ncbi:hypothetical protein QBC43DRAFT_284239 [Cladorrhinum sp. PSN259]|nr:hypothetical protein QBC43DRAFT_284239 [Cladorrhinum sp. PSN259]